MQNKNQIKQSLTSQVIGLLDVLPGGGMNGGEADFLAFLWLYRKINWHSSVSTTAGGRQNDIH